jgi:hypothetical protein
MKKLFATLAVAGLTTAAAFAQTPAPAPAVAITGSLDFGGLVTAVKKDWNIQSFDPVNNTTGRLNLNIKYDGGNFGWYVRVREQGGGYGSVKDSTGNATANDGFVDNSGTWALRRAYAWIDLFDGQVRVSGGRLNTQSWAAGSYGNDFADIGALDGAIGTTVEFKPAAVPGLNFGGYIPYTANKTNFRDSLATSVIAASYKVNGLGDAQVGYSVGSADRDAYVAGSSTVNSYFYVGAAYTADKNLIAQGIVYKATNVVDGLNGAATVSRGFTYLSERVEYSFGDLLNVPVHAALLATQQFFAESTLGTAAFYNPSVDYTMDIYNFGLSAVYLTDSADALVKNSGYEIDPFVKVTVAKNVSIKAFVGFTSGKDTLGANYGDAAGVTGAPGFLAPTNSYSASKSNTANGYAFNVLPETTTKFGVSTSINY